MKLLLPWFALGTGTVRALCLPKQQVAQNIKLWLEREIIEGHLLSGE